MTAKALRLSIGIGITYLLSIFHDVWWKTVLALIFLSFNLLRAFVYPQYIEIRHHLLNVLHAHHGTKYDRHLDMEEVKEDLEQNENKPS